MQAVHKFRIAMKPIAFQVARYSLAGGAICFAIGVVLAEESRTIAMRCFSGFLVVLSIFIKVL